jgi:hypothetical protein
MPPFRADHVGSLIRPQELRDGRQARLEGRLPAAELAAIEDRLIREVIALQERVGLQAVTDGEFRRTSFREVLFESMHGFSRERVDTDFSFSYADGSSRRATPVPNLPAQAQWQHGRGRLQVPEDGHQGHAQGHAPGAVACALVHRRQGIRRRPLCRCPRVHGGHRRHLS